MYGKINTHFRTISSKRRAGAKFHRPKYFWSKKKRRMHGWAV